LELPIGDCQLPIADFTVATAIEWARRSEIGNWQLSIGNGKWIVSQGNDKVFTLKMAGHGLFRWLFAVD
jgi:hypothetical protein